MRSADPPHYDSEFLRNRQALQALLFSTTKLMEISASVLVRTPSIPQKLELSRNIWALAQSSQLLVDRIGSLRTRVALPRPGSREYADFIDDVISLSDPVREHEILEKLAYPDLRDCVELHRTRVPASDEVTVDCLNQVRERLTELSLPGPQEPVSAPLHFPFPKTGALSCGLVRENLSLEKIFIGRRTLERIPNRPGRDALVTQERTRDREERLSKYGPILYDFAFRIELCAAEICAALLAHHTEAPWGLRFDLARQLRDEIRHFELFISRANELGCKIGDLPVRFEVWDNFILGNDLAERLIIEQRLGEGGAIDSADNIYKRLKEDGEEELASAFQYVTADEIVHVANGNKWLRYLLGNDEAVAKLENKIKDRLKACRSVEVYKHPISVENRQLAGFTLVEIENIQQEFTARENG
ncbi:DUF455 family protein [Actinomadura latina]|uniref:DUF455 family protein n=1 Tax=Actinomadura latina TaxID=163603 RepID=A0A846Z1S5_9ACTN|nr:DUF455 family protein [Actinomadura latina]NKZ04343.1 DUF455 family protein [Actinomadura latina]